jgi:hypothetical protein
LREGNLEFLEGLLRDSLSKKKINSLNLFFETYAKYSITVLLKKKKVAKFLELFPIRITKKTRVNYRVRFIQKVSKKLLVLDERRVHLSHKNLRQTIFKNRFRDKII